MYVHDINGSLWQGEWSHTTVGTTRTSFRLMVTTYAKELAQGGKRHAPKHKKSRNWKQTKREIVTLHGTIISYTIVLAVARVLVHKALTCHCFLESTTHLILVTVRPLHLHTHLCAHGQVCRLLLDSPRPTDEITAAVAPEDANRNKTKKAGDFIGGSYIDPDAAAAEGTTPLHWACWGAHLGTCRLLVSRGADHRKINAHGCNVAHWCGLAGDVEVCRCVCTRARLCACVSC